MTRRYSAISFCLGLAIAPVVVFAQPAPATAPAPAAAAPSAPAAGDVPNAAYQFIGEVTANSVNVRSGPADSHYVTTRLTKGDRVVVVGHKFEWLKIIPPKGSFSYVAKLYIDRDGAGNTGTINKNEVSVRAGSDRVPLKNDVQTTLSQGTKVQIIGEQDEYFKIAPPEGAFVYVSKQFVTPVREATTKESAAPTVTLAPSEERAWSDATKTPAAKPPMEPAETVKAPEQPAAADAQAQFAAAERQFESTKDQPIEQRPISDMLKTYRELADNASLSSGARTTARNRAALLAIQEKQVAEITQAKQSTSDFAARQAELDEQARKIEQRLQAAGIASYAAVGQLQMSTITRADNQPLLRLVDPADGRTLVYVKLTDNKQRPLLDKFVGVKGEVARDPQLSIDVIEPSDMQEVDPAKVFHGVTAKIYPPSLSRPKE